MNIEINIDADVDVDEFRKVVSFVSKDILSYQIVDNIMILEIKENSDKERIEFLLTTMSKKYKKIIHEEDVEYFKKNERKYYTDVIEDKQLFMVMGDGLLCLKDKAICLFRFFEHSFAKMAANMGAIEKSYPVLLPVDEYIKTGYISRTPQYAIFCSDVHESIDELNDLSKAIEENRVSSYLNSPQLALSPSACFHTYIEMKNQELEENSIISFTQNVFRNEGRLNYDEIGRLRDYHVREVVFVGDEEFVCSSRKKFLNNIKEFVVNIGLEGKVQVSSDSFVLPKMQKYRKIQMIDNSKYELRLNINEKKDIAVGSFNLHGMAFTSAFNIRVRNCKNAVTGCVGFGIERWVLAFLCQYGKEEKNWPECVRKFCEKYSDI